MGFASLLLFTILCLHYRDHNHSKLWIAQARNVSNQKKKSSNLLKAATRLAKQDDDRPSRHPKARGINYLLVMQWSVFGECKELRISGDEVEEAGKWSCAGDLLLCCLLFGV